MRLSSCAPGVELALEPGVLGRTLGYVAGDSERRTTGTDRIRCRGLRARELVRFELKLGDSAIVAEVEAAPPGEKCASSCESN